MKSSPFGDGQVTGILTEHEPGKSAAEPCGRHRISEPTPGPRPRPRRADGWPPMISDFPLSGLRVARELDKIAKRRGWPDIVAATTDRPEGDRHARIGERRRWRWPSSVAGPSARHRLPGAGKGAVTNLPGPVTLQDLPEMHRIHAGNMGRIMRDCPGTLGSRTASRLEIMVPTPRLERGTPRSTIWCSNLLSYVGSGERG